MSWRKRIWHWLWGHTFLAWSIGYEVKGITGFGKKVVLFTQHRDCSVCGFTERRIL